MTDVDSMLILKVILPLRVGVQCLFLYTFLDRADTTIACIGKEQNTGHKYSFIMPSIRDSCHNLRDSESRTVLVGLLP